MKKFVVSLLGFSFLAVPALAQDASYSRADVVKRLTDQQLDLEKPRSVCVGADSECADEPQTRGFDMRITFEFGSAELTEKAKQNLDVVASALEEGSLMSTKFLVEGHTDAAGGDNYNMNLSSERAKAVMSYLESKNVSADRLKAIGFGKKFPLPNEDELSPENRRVELKIQAE
jgi:outer membrane protein OmpA-like peptidoglycan-associated protein